MLQQQLDTICTGAEGCSASICGICHALLSPSVFRVLVVSFMLRVSIASSVVCYLVDVFSAVHLAAAKDLQSGRSRALTSLNS
jgi:hypothetical protein